MEHTGHQFTGYTAALVVAPLIPHPPSNAALTTLGYVSLTGLGSLLPDMDMPSATAAKLLGPVTKFLAWCINKLSIFVFELTRTPSDRHGRYPGHRELTHTALWGLIVGGLTFWGVSAAGAPSWAFWAAMSMMTGHFAHLWGDAITMGGIPFFAPLIKIDGKRWANVWFWPKPMRFYVGAHREKGRIKTESRWAWLNIGEGVVTSGLALATGLLAGLTLIAAGDPWWTPITS
jgi:membrane-bound metal-dependent hydrolase YbcI (DUF457 family)